MSCRVPILFPDQGKKEYCQVQLSAQRQRVDDMRMTLRTPTFVFAVTALCTVFITAVSAQPTPSPVVHHDLAVTVDPATHRLQVRDRMRIPGALVTGPLTISLNADLELGAASGALSLVRSRAPGADTGMDREDRTTRVPVNIYRVEGAVPGQDWTGEFTYQGVIDYRVRDAGANMRVRSASRRA